jgi:hypothetical protein
MKTNFISVLGWLVATCFTPAVTAQTPTYTVELAPQVLQFKKPTVAQLELYHDTLFIYGTLVSTVGDTQTPVFRSFVGFRHKDSATFNMVPVPGLPVVASYGVSMLVRTIAGKTELVLAGLLDSQFGVLSNFIARYTVATDTWVVATVTDSGVFVPGLNFVFQYNNLQPYFASDTTVGHVAIAVDIATDSAMIRGVFTNLQGHVLAECSAPPVPNYDPVAAVAASHVNNQLHVHYRDNTTYGGMPPHHKLHNAGAGSTPTVAARKMPTGAFGFGFPGPDFDRGDYERQWYDFRNTSLYSFSQYGINTWNLATGDSALLPAYQSPLTGESVAREVVKQFGPRFIACIVGTADTVGYTMSSIPDSIWIYSTYAPYISAQLYPTLHVFKVPLPEELRPISFTYDTTADELFLLGYIRPGRDSALINSGEVVHPNDLVLWRVQGLFAEWVGVPEQHHPDILFAVYPNPVAPGQVVQVSNSADVLHIELLDALGRTVFTSRATDSFVCPEQPAGVYLLRCQSASGLRHSSRLVVE